MRPFALRILLFFCWVRMPWAEAGWELEAGALMATPSQRYYLLPKEEYSWDAAGGTSWSFKAAARGVLERNDSYPALSEPRAEIRALSVSFSRGRLKTTLGFQEIAWGETFGVQIADVVNPRDFRDPLLANDLGWIRIPVFALNSQLFLDRLTLQAIFTPVPRNPGGVGTDSEFGGRASYLFDSGLDLGAIYYRHWNRDLSAALMLFAQVDTYALTASQAFGKFVFRGDAVWNHGEPLVPDDWRTVVGTDVSLDDELTLGFQFQTDRTELASLNWSSFLVRGKVWGGKIEPEFFVFYGLNNPDVWLQPKVGWNITPAFSLSLRADLIGAGDQVSDGALGMLKGQSRVLAWLALKI